MIKSSSGVVDDPVVKVKSALGDISLLVSAAAKMNPSRNALSNDESDLYGQIEVEETQIEGIYGVLVTQPDPYAYKEKNKRDDYLPMPILRIVVDLADVNQEINAIYYPTGDYAFATSHVYSLEHLSEAAKELATLVLNHPLP